MTMKSGPYQESSLKTSGPEPGHYIDHAILAPLFCESNFHFLDVIYMNVKWLTQQHSCRLCHYRGHLPITASQCPSEVSGSSTSTANDASALHVCSFHI